MGVSKNNGSPKSSILIGFFIINHPFWGTPIFGKHPYTFRNHQCLIPMLSSQEMSITPRTLGLEGYSLYIRIYIYTGNMIFFGKP